jgi:hypothetical protein
MVTAYFSRDFFRRARGISLGENGDCGEEKAGTNQNTLHHEVSP